MKYFLFLFTTLLPAICLRAQVIHVPAGEPTIQAGIDASSDGDTVLVDPGLYHEHVVIEDKNITLASLFLVTGDTSFVSQTVVSFDQCYYIVEVHGASDSTMLISGFTIGGSEMAGGLLCNDAILTIDQCRIAENRTEWPAGNGGGIYNTGHVHLKNSLVSNNSASGYGGGICNHGTMLLEDVDITHNQASVGGGMYGSSVEFDGLNRCNVHSNFANIAKDLFFSEPVSIVLDTFTVLQPTNFFVNCFSNCTFDILHGKLQQISADLYVSPGGDDANSGLSPDDPLKTIHHALSVIYSDSLDPQTVYLSGGTYGPSANGEKFSLNLPFFTSLRGTGPELVFLDGENDYGSGPPFCLFEAKGSGISGLTIMNGMNGGIISAYSDADLKEMVIRDNVFEFFPVVNTGGGLVCFESDLRCEGLVIENNTNISFDPYFYGGGLSAENSKLTLEDCAVCSNNAFWGGGMYLDRSEVKLLNVTVSGNSVIGIASHGGTLEARDLLLSDNPDGMEYYGENSNSRFINSTIARTSGQSAVPLLNHFMDSLHVSNCIVWGLQAPYQVSVSGTSDRWGILEIGYSDLKGGQKGIKADTNSFIAWGEGNIDQEPLFAGSGGHPYELSDASPCIDAGTTDTTGLSLPVWDLMGNYRLWDGDGNGDTIIDMGAYEFGSVGMGADQLAVGSWQLAVIIYPNPASSLVTVEADGLLTNCTFAIYNLHGQELLRQRITQATTVIDISRLPSGIYFHRTRTTDNGQSEIGKLVIW
jgi:hypothetical protein